MYCVGVSVVTVVTIQFDYDSPGDDSVQFDSIASIFMQSITLSYPEYQQHRSYMPILVQISGHGCAYQDESRMPRIAMHHPVDYC